MMGALTRRKGYVMVVLLTPRRVAFAAAEAFAEGLLGFAFAPGRVLVVSLIEEGGGIAISVPELVE